MALDLCFFNKECIRKREEEKANAQKQIEQQQQTLIDITNKPTGGLNAWAITGIIAGTLALSIFIIYMIKKRKKAK